MSPCLLNKLELSSGEQTKALNQLERVLLFKNLKVSLPLPLLFPFLFNSLHVYFFNVIPGNHFHCTTYLSLVTQLGFGRVAFVCSFAVLGILLGPLVA
jgi:hypothetical protein